MKMRLGRGYRAVAYVDVPGRRCDICIIWNCAGDLGQSAGLDVRCHTVLQSFRGALMSRRAAERRTQHAVMATASEWARIRELAAAAGMDLSRYIVHRATVPDPLPDTVLRRAVRELLLLAKIEEQRMADMGLEERWKALGDAVDACSTGRPSSTA